MKKQKKAITAKKHKRDLTIMVQPGESEEQAVARTMMNPALQSAITLLDYINSPEEIYLTAMIDSLEKQVDLVKSGDLTSVEQIFLVQAHTLDAIANYMFRRARNQEYMSNFEAHMKLGLRAQNQCRTTLEALVRTKTPKTHLNQTNIGYHQQVNNRLEKAQSKLSSAEEMYGKRMDPETPQEAVRSDTPLEAVGAKHWPKNAGRKG